MNQSFTAGIDGMDGAAAVLGNGQAEQLKQVNGDQTVSKKKLAMCLNLRDVGATMPDKLRTGIIFRSSQLLSGEDMERYGVHTVLDLRRMDRPCKKKGNKIDQIRLAGRYVQKGPKILMGERMKPYALRGQPHACELCRQRISDKLGFEPGTVVHADLIPSLVGLRIFQAMPASVRCKAVVAALAGKGAASVMAPAVANPLYMGYKALYKTILEDSKRGIAKAMRVFCDPDNLPVLIHCIHGKDRTGIVVMLLLLLCDVDPKVIVDDYVRSEVVLKESRMHKELDLDVYLTQDSVIAATHDTMEDTIKYLLDKYGSVAGYLHEVGLEDWEMSRIRVNLLRQAGAHDLLERLSLLSPLPGHSGGNRTSSNFQRMFNKRAARSTPSLQRSRSLPEGEEAPSRAEVLDTLGSSPAKIGSSDTKEEVAVQRLAVSSAPPVVDRTTLHPTLHTEAKALVKSDTTVSSQPLRNELLVENKDSVPLDVESEAAKDTSTASAWAQIVEGTKGPDFGNVASSASSKSTIR
ncbi:g6170 [Coccomyxa elongata]